MKIKANVVIKFTTQFNIAIWFCVLGIGFEGLKTKSFSNFDAFSFEPFFCRGNCFFQLAVLSALSV